MKAGLPSRIGLRRMSAALLGAGLALAAAQQVPGEAAGEAGSSRASYRDDSLRLAFRGDSVRQRMLDSRWAYLQALQLDESGEACVAYDPGRGECLLTVDDWNRNVAEAPAFPGAERFASVRDVPAAALRVKLLSSLLHGEYLRSALERDSARAGLERECRARADSQVAEQRRQIGDSALRALYQARFDRDFRRREEPVIQVLATSDSVLADSLWKSFSDSGGKGPAGSWVWRSPDPEDLPRGIPEMAATLARGEVSKPWPTPYGYLLARWKSVRRRAALSFEEALPMLVAHPRLKHPDSLGAARARENLIAEYHRSHRREFLSPDTLRLRLRLTPAMPAAKGRTEAGLSRLSRDSGAAPVENPRSVRVASFADLPPSVQTQLSDLPMARPGTRIGPVPSAFGTWDFEVVGKTRGGRIMALAQARPAVLQALRLRDEEPMAKVADEIRAEERTTWNFLAQAYRERRLASGDASGGDPGAAKPVVTLAADKLHWLRTYLHIRFIDLGKDS